MWRKRAVFAARQLELEENKPELGEDKLDLGEARVDREKTRLTLPQTRMFFGKTLLSARTWPCLETRRRYLREIGLISGRIAIICEKIALNRPRQDNAAAPRGYLWKSIAISEDFQLDFFEDNHLPA